MIDLQDAVCKYSVDSQPPGFSSASKIGASAILISLFLGATAAHAKTVYVNGAVSKPGSGTSWSSAYKYLRDALDQSSSADLIYVAKGTYYPDDGASGDFGNREKSFELKGQRVYGGFAGTETSLSQRNTKANPTVLSGAIWDLAGEDVYWSLHVVFVSASSTLDGFTVEKGHASGSNSWNYPAYNPYDEGGGCYVSAGKVLTLSGCNFRNNRALSFGGAIMVEDDSGKVVANDCVFEGNEIPLIYGFTTGIPAGGAIKGNVVATRCKFSNNTVRAHNFVDGTTSIATGGAIAGDVVATNCEFTGNSALAGGEEAVVPEAFGGAISGNLKAVRCSFTANQSIAQGDDGTGISSGGAVGGGSVVAMNCAFVGNTGGIGKIEDDGTGSGGGGAVYVSEGKSVIANCVFVNNNSGVRGGAIHAGTSSNSDSLVLANSTFLDNGVALAHAGAALSCGGIVRILDNIFWYTAADTGSVTRGDQIHVIKDGVLRNSLTNYPDPSSMAPNIVRKPDGAPAGSGVSRGQEGDVFLGPLAPAILSGDPRFVNIADPDGADNVWGTADDGLRIQTGSAAIGISRDPRILVPVNPLPKDALDIDGDGDIQEFLPIDMTGVVRVQNSYVDLGAYEIGNLANISEISISVSNATQLTDGGSFSFGKVAKGAILKKDFTITNLGRSGLKIVSYSLTGSGAFILQKPFVGSIKPGASVKFAVNFKPSGNGKQTAILRIANNDPDEGTFDIDLSGTGVVKKAVKKSANPAAAASNIFLVSSPVASGPSTPAVTTATAEDGSKYLVLTVRKSSGGPGWQTVEVSSDLLDWYSGPAHTTTLTDSATILSVRDNTPLTQGEKRYIRLK